jgi:beta-1,4-mannosyltransferase
MHPFRVDRAQNQFTSMLGDALLSERGLEVAEFTWGAFLLGRYDVLHVHWPEALILGKTRLHTFAKVLLLGVGRAVAAARGRTVVGTAHNLRPHENVGRFASFAWVTWHRALSGRVYLTRWGMSEFGHRWDCFIPHGDYAPELAELGIQVPLDYADIRPGQLVCFGQLRRYKQVDHVVRAVRGSDVLSLTVAGRPVDQEYADELLREAEFAPSVNLVLDSVPMTELSRILAESSAVVIAYREVNNSGAALLALSLGRPLITASSPTMKELQAEVGPDWVRLLPDGWTSADLEEAASGLASVDRTGKVPSLLERDWSRIGSAHARFYRRLLNGRV